MYLHKLKIKNIELENNIFLAPMAGITDLPFRLICKEFRPGLVFTEMISSKGIFYNDEKTIKLMNMEGEKRPVAVQIFGSDLDAIKCATKYVSKYADIIDINMGCPAPKVVKNGDGSRLLLNLELIGKIVETAVKNSNGIPISVKIRKGWDKENIVAIEAAKIIESAGASMITIHGRTRDEYYSGNVDLKIIKKVKESVNIPVIGNGDIIDENSAVRMFEYTGVDGIMIGRGALGNPWIFDKIVYYLKTGKYKNNVTNNEKLNIILKHLDLLVKEKGETIAVKEMRKHIGWYIKNLKNSSKIRGIINTINDRKSLEYYLIEYFKSI